MGVPSGDNTSVEVSGTLTSVINTHGCSKPAVSIYDASHNDVGTGSSSFLGVGGKQSVNFDFVVRFSGAPSVCVIGG